MDILEKHVTYEETIKGSRFLSELIPCSSQAEAREILKAQKAKYADATHVVHAFITGNGAEVKGMSDDGEPSGTAGRPALDVLSGRGCTNVILTITRWFGGTLLGTGGLVKAYGNGAKGVIAAADQEGAFQPLVEKRAFTFSTDYSLLKPVKNLMECGSFHFWNIKEEFGTEVTLTGEIQSDEYQAFASKLKDLSNGKITL
ncbi:YigZ family protein [Treponema sp. C6A8]|uniref:IMPACT family protein n=1 Tax=Treponema sp. C6A8 TaxID=1410609 RepID=UPI00047F93CA|nr:YigZ family protein [Treponema sp. C6A8]